jgi:hypothetical protein
MGHVRVSVIFRGQLYRRIAIELYVRADGSATQLATWESQCPVCGEPFTIQTTQLRSCTGRRTDAAIGTSGRARQCAGNASNG